MKSRFLILVVTVLILSSESKAQTTELLGGNLLNGAVTGSILGAATMGLNNSGDFAPVRIGLGAGIIGGAGIAVYDLATLPMGSQFYISGVFNDGRNSSILVLMDTFYGAASGAVIGVAGMLVAEERLVEGLQYGASIGAWTGFAFGLVDTFLLAERNRDFSSANWLNRDSLIAMSSDRYQLGLIQPAIYTRPSIDLSGPGDLSLSPETILQVVSLKMDF